FRGGGAVVKQCHLQRRMIRHQRMQFYVTRHLGVGDEKSRPDSFTPTPREAAIKRHVKDVLKGELDRVQRSHVGKTIEWSSQFFLLLDDKDQNLVHLRLVQRAARPPNKKAHIFDKRNIHR